MPSPTADELRQGGRRLSANDFAGTIRAYYPFWDAQYRPLLLKAVEAFPAEHFDFKPNPASLTAHQTIVHIAEAETAWITRIVEGGPDVEWVAPHADPAQGWVTVVDAPDHAALLERLADAHRLTQRYLERPAGEIGRVITYTRPNGEQRSLTLHWVLDHLQEHEIHHRAQLNLYLRMLGVEPPSI